MARLVPTAKRLVVRRHTADKTSEGGIIIPDAAQEKQSRGEVVAVGDEALAFCQPGDVVVFGRYAGTEVEEGGEPLVVMTLDEVLAKAV